MSVATLLEGKDICICAGAGGVGKTTTSAAIGVGMARRGLKVAVLTIDPARRLANSLGLPELGNEERQIELDAPGELWAMMLDAKTTFDEIVDKHAPDASTRDAVLSNRIYKELSTAVAGSQEYMAMEKLHELHAEGRYDLLVLDTPPSRNALDFLDAPDRLSRFIDSRSLQFFLAPSRTGLKIFSPRDGHALLDPEAHHRRGPAAGPVRLLRELRRHGVGLPRPREGRQGAARGRPHDVPARHLGGARGGRGGEVLPRQARGVRHAVRRGDRQPDARRGARRVRRTCDSLDPELAEKVAANFKDFHALAERDRQNVEELTADMGERPLIIVPYLDEDIHDLAGIEAMDDHLFAGDVVQTGAE